MSKPVKYFAIIGALVAAGLFAYAVFFKDQGVSTGSLLVRTEREGVSDSAAVTELLLVLKGLQNLSLDTKILNDAAYRSLRDYSVILEVSPQKKANPFAPL